MSVGFGHNYDIFCRFGYCGDIKINIFIAGWENLEFEIVRFPFKHVFSIFPGRVWIPVWPVSCGGKLL